MEGSGMELVFALRVVPRAIVEVAMNYVAVGGVVMVATVMALALLHELRPRSGA